MNWKLYTQYDHLYIHSRGGSDKEPTSTDISTSSDKPKKVEVIINEYSNSYIKLQENAVKPFVHKKITISKSFESECEEPLPIPFELSKNFSQDVQKDLEENRLIGRTRKFIASICSAIFRYKAHPNKAEYNHVGEQIVKKYPFLRSKTGSGYEAALYQTILYMHAYTCNNNSPCILVQGYLADLMRDKMKCEAQV